jgi:hypothetical protein
MDNLVPVTNSKYRDEAMRQTRRLQADITAEREKVKALMAQS